MGQILNKQETVRSLSAGQLDPLEQLQSLLGLKENFDGEATLLGADPILRSPHRLSEATSYALLAEAMAAASIWKFRAKKAVASSIELSVYDAIHALHSTHFLWHSGYSLSVGAEFIPTNGLFRCRDGQYIMTESGPPYVKLERGYLNFFDCGNNKQSLAREIAKFDAFELQEKLNALGLPASVAFTPDEWRSLEHGTALLQTPVIEIEKIADGPPIPFSNSASYPLDGIRVLDFTHVLAGPRSMRSLAQYGAEVLHISSPYNRDTVSQNLLVNIGKRSAYLLLTEEKDRRQMTELLKEADVFSFSYRPGVAERFGLQPDELARGHKGIVCLSVNAYGHVGPWKDRPGFDHNIQVATGVARTEGGADAPRLSPVFYLNDFLTGYLAAAGVMAALLRRAVEGGSYNVKVSLARSAMWVQDLGLISEQDYGTAPEKDEYPSKLHTIQTSCGAVTELEPAASFSDLPRKNLDSLRPFGADPPTWI